MIEKNIMINPTLVLLESDKVDVKGEVMVGVRNNITMFYYRADLDHDCFTVKFMNEEGKGFPIFKREEWEKLELMIKTHMCTLRSDRKFNFMSKNRGYK
jgi:hypothetical protein